MHQDISFKDANNAFSIPNNNLPLFYLVPTNHQFPFLFTYFILFLTSVTLIALAFALIMAESFSIFLCRKPLDWRWLREYLTPGALEGHS